MFAYAESRAFVCLRCQIRLDRIHNARPSPFARPRRLFSAATRLANDGQNAALQDNTQDNWTSPDKWRRTLKALQAHGKPYSRPGQEVQEKTVTLPMNRLGEPADVLVIQGAEKDASRLNERKEQDDTQEVDTKLTGADIIAAIEEGKRHATPADIVRQIDSLRPPISAGGATDTYIPRLEFDRLFSLLVDGYTFTQLQLYIDRKAYRENLKASRSSAKTENPNASDQHVFVVSEWRPEIVPIDEHFPKRWLWYTHSGGTRKERIVWYLMRKYWQLKIIEEPEPVGQVQLRTNALTFDLLAVGSPSKLQQVGSERNIKVESDRSSRLIRLTATKDNALRAVEFLESICKSALEASLDVNRLAWWPTSARRLDMQHTWLSAVDLAAVSNLTRTSLTMNADGLISVQACSNDELADAIRAIHILAELRRRSANIICDPTLAHAAVLNHSLPAPNNLPFLLHEQHWVRPTHHVVAHAAQSERGASREVPSPHTPGDTKDAASLPKKGCPISNDRHGQEERTDAMTDRRQLQHKSVGKEAGSATFKASARALIQHVTSSLTQLMSGLPKTTMMSSHLTQNTSLWTKPPIWVKCATIGTIALPENFTIARSRKASQNQGTRSQFFLDSTPGMIQLLPFLSADTQASASRKDTLSFRLIPSPMQNESTLLPKLPEVFIEYEVNSLAEPQPHAALRKVVMRYLHDETHVMQPTYVADMRYTEQATLECAADDYAKGLSPDLDSWIVKTKESILGGGRIRPGSTVDINLPQWLVNATAPKPSTPRQKRPTTREKQLEAERLVRITYLFAGVEHREVVPFQFRDFELVYTSREGGKMGGRGGSLSLRYGTADDWKRPLDAKSRRERERFIAAAFEVLQMVDQAVKGTLGPRPMLSPPSDERVRSVS